MKITLAILIIALPLIAAGAAGLCLASDIGDANYYGTVRVSNNSTAAEDVSATFALSSDELMDLYGVSENFSNTAMRTNSGVDTTFMPGYDTNDWCVFVPDIAGSASVDYKLYIGGDSEMDGDIAYFPGTNGLSTLDNADMEPSDNFSFEIGCYVKPSENQYIILKGAALQLDVYNTMIRGLIAGGSTVTVSSVTQGFHSIRFYADSTNLGIIVDEGLAGESSNTTSLGGVGVPDNGTDWHVGNYGGSGVKYLTYYKHSVGGVLKQWLEWEYGDTFTDLSGNGHDATPVFRTTSSDADVSAALLNFQPVSQAKASTVALGAAGEIMTDPPEEPSPMYTPTGEISLFFAPLINSILDFGGISRALFWYSACFLIIGIAGYFSFKYNQSILITSAIMWAVMFIFTVTNVYGAWTLVYFSCEIFGINVMAKHYGW